MMRGSESLQALLRRAVRELDRLEARFLERTGSRLRPGSVPLLAALLDEAPLSATELCERCDVEPSTMTGLLRTLESHGLIERTKVVLDQRRQAITLSARGRSAARIAVRARARAEETVRGVLSGPVARALDDGALEALVAAARAAARAGGDDRD